MKPVGRPNLVLYLALSCAVIPVALLGAWKIGVVLLFLAALIASDIRGMGGVVFVVCALTAVYLEVILGEVSSPAKGVSYVNLVLGAGFFLAALKNLKNHKRILIQSPLNLPILLLVCYQLASLLISFSKGVYENSLSDLLISYKNSLNPILLLLIVVNLIDSEREAALAVRMIFVFYAFFLLLSLFSYFGLLSMPTFMDMDSDTRTLFAGPFQPGFRMTGSFSGPNLFAGFLVLFMPFLSVSIFSAKKQIFRVGFLLSTMAAALVLVMTGSRGGYIGFVAACSALFFLLSKYRLFRLRRLIVFAAWSLVLIAVLLLLFPNLFLVNVGGRFTFEEEPDLDVLTKGRFSLWKEGAEAFLVSPVFGRGWKLFKDFHNAFLQSLATLGVVGFGLSVWIYWMMIAVPLRRVATGSWNFQNVLNIGFAAGFIGLMTVMLSVELYYVYNFLFLYAGLVLRYNQIGDKENSRAHPAHPSLATS